MNISTTLKPTTLALADKPIAEYQDGLKSRLTWLNYSFGRAQRLLKQENGRNIYYPGIHLRNEDYLSMFPDEQFGNYCFWSVDDPEILPSFEMRQSNRLEFNVSLIFWVNLDTIYTNTTERNTESLKVVILAALKSIYATTGRFTPTNIYKIAENIYRGYNINEFSSQFLMHPFYGLRIEGKLIMNEGG